MTYSEFQQENYRPSPMIFGQSSLGLSSAIHSLPSEWEETVEPRPNSKPPRRDRPEKLHFARDEAGKSQNIGSGKEAKIFKSRE
jgi:hypothetical protein